MNGHLMRRYENVLAGVARQYGGRLHGTDGAGICDIEFMDAHSALAFARGIEQWVTLRDPITVLTEAVVLQVNGERAAQHFLPVPSATGPWWAGKTSV